MKQGLIKVAYSLDDGTERLMGYFIPGMVFAQLGSFFQDSSSGMEYEAAIDTNVIRLPKEEFLQQLRNDMELSQEYMQGILKNQIFLIERLEYQGEKGMRYKYIKWLLFMCKHYGDSDGTLCVITIPITQEIIANFLLATRESASKITNQLVRQNLIKIDKRQLILNDISALKKLIEH